MKNLFQNHKIIHILGQMTNVKQVLFSLIGGIVLVFLFLSLLSYSSLDPAWSHVSAEDNITNIGGRAGAWLADIFQVFFGIGSWWVILVLAYELVLLWWQRNSTMWQLRVLAYGFILLCLSGVLAGWAVKQQSDAMATGGVLGYRLYTSLASSFGMWATMSLLVVLALIVAVLAFDFKIKWLSDLEKNAKNNTDNDANNERFSYFDDGEDDIFDVVYHANQKGAGASLKLQNTHQNVFRNFLIQSGLKDEVLAGKFNHANINTQEATSVSINAKEVALNVENLNIIEQNTPQNTTIAPNDTTNIAQQTPSDTTSTDNQTSMQTSVHTPVSSSHKPSINESLVNLTKSANVISSSNYLKTEQTQVRIDDGAGQGVQDDTARITNTGAQQELKPSDSYLKNTNDHQSAVEIKTHENPVLSTASDEVGLNNTQEAVQVASTNAVDENQPANHATSNAQFANDNVLPEASKNTEQHVENLGNVTALGLTSQEPSAGASNQSVLDNQLVNSGQGVLGQSAQGLVVANGVDTQGLGGVNQNIDQNPIQSHVQNHALNQTGNPTWQAAHNTVSSADTVGDAESVTEADTNIILPNNGVMTADDTAVSVKPDVFADTNTSRAMDTLSYRMSLPPIPPLDILDKPDLHKEPSYDEYELQELSDLLEIKLREFNIKARVDNSMVGPVVTRFEVELAPGIKASRVSGIAQDLARSLSIASLRVVEVIPGKPYIGIEIPNKKREMVRLIELLDTPEFKNPDSQISVAIGKDIGGRVVIADLAKAPHMLVAGTTGSGKSVFVNSILLSILLKCTPDEMKMVLIDPKQLELANYSDIPHLLTPVITDMTEATAALTWCVNEMERRYQLMSLLRVRKISEFNKKIEQAEASGQPIFDPLWREDENVSIKTAPKLKSLPYIVIVADEFADMIMQLGKTAEEPIVRLAQKARAAGIHLMLATQRPTVNVVTGLIKANIPSRVALKVNSKVDSRTIIEEGGAEDMLGNGDMMFIGPGKNNPERVHGAFVSDDEVNRVCDAWRERGSPDYIDLSNSYTFEGEGSGDKGAGGDDEYYHQAVTFVMESRKVSISAIQRKLGIGYNRAARLVEMMEEAGLVTPPDNRNIRQLLM